MTELLTTIGACGIGFDITVNFDLTRLYLEVVSFTAKAFNVITKMIKLIQLRFYSQKFRSHFKKEIHNVLLHVCLIVKCFSRAE